MVHFYLMYFILFSGHPGISVNELSPLSLRGETFAILNLIADSLLLDEVTSPRKREYKLVKRIYRMLFSAFISIF